LIFKLNEVFNYHVFLNKIEKPNVFFFGCLLEIKSKLWPKNNMVKNCRDLQPHLKKSKLLYKLPDYFDGLE
jgi:hypothetical protein